MGNKIGRRRQAVDEKYTRPQGLYQHRDVDHKKLRKLILDSKLAPCYPGDDDALLDLEECPICFLYYPSLNRSRCCLKGICTECFLQMKPPNDARPTQCPFCKTSNYAVEYRGVKTKEEKGMEQVEEQRVIEAQIRVRQKELHAEEERMQRKQEITSSSIIMTPAEVEHQNVSMPSCRYSAHGDALFTSQGSCTVSTSRRPSHLRQNREDNFDLDLEEIMVMEAIWLSIQEQGSHRNAACGGSSFLGASSPTETSPSGGLACAAAALAEHQHMNGEESNADAPSRSRSSVFNMLQQSGYSLPAGEDTAVRNYPPENWIEVSPGSGRGAAPREEGDWAAADYGSEVAEAGTSNASSSDITMDAGSAALSLSEGGADSAVAGHHLPESFEEQMMLAMAVSLAEARARTGTPGLAWL